MHPTRRRSNRTPSPVTTDRRHDSRLRMIQGFDVLVLPDAQFRKMARPANLLFQLDPLIKEIRVWLEVVFQAREVRHEGTDPEFLESISPAVFLQSDQRAGLTSRDGPYALEPLRCFRCHRI